MTLADLKEHARELGLPTSRRKAALLEALHEALLRETMQKA